MKVEQAYTAWSSTYDEDRNLTRDLDEIVTRQTLAGLHFKSILEIGCGTGKNTAFLADLGDQVLAIDFSEAMIAKARAKVRAGNVTFEIANLNQSWPCADRSADLITCNLVLEHIRDLAFVFSEAARTLSDEGEFFISELHPFRQYLGTQARFSRDQQTISIPSFVHHISEFIYAAAASQLTLLQMNEWWHDLDQNKPPRIVSFMFRG